MKIFRCEQIRQIDHYTIMNEPVASTDLMERAAMKLAEWYTLRFLVSSPILIFAGPGNNGGDGLALARLLACKQYKPVVCYIDISENRTQDWEINWRRLHDETNVPFITLTEIDRFPLIHKNTLVIDAIFGSGLSRPPEGLAAGVIQKINSSGATVISIDIPSGLSGEDNRNCDTDKIIRASFTLSFQFPKLSFMFPENHKYTGEWVILPIGLHPKAIDDTETPYIFLEKKMLRPLLKKRNKFDHKGVFGHGLLIGGSSGKMGSMVLGARAALRTGAGLLTCHIPSGGDVILQEAVPEAMTIHDKNSLYITDTPDPGSYSALGIGSGMGTEPDSQKVVHSILLGCRKPVVIDADALNILSLNKDWLTLLPESSILTPHLKEFERLTGISSDGFDRINRQINFSSEYKCIVVLKGAYTSISGPGYSVWFNSSGNPGMATAGSGDVLTGMILSLLAQGYEPLNAALTGVYLHGLAGDIAAEHSCYESIIASDIINNISNAFNRIREKE